MDRDLWPLFDALEERVRNLELLVREHTAVDESTRKEVDNLQLGREDNRTRIEKLERTTDRLGFKQGIFLSLIVFLGNFIAAIVMKKFP